MIMKSVKKYIIGLLAVMILFAGCDKDLTEINTNKTDFTSMDPAFMLNSAIIDITNSRTARNYMNEAHTIIQWFVVPFGSSFLGANYNQWSTFQEQPFSSYYPSAVPKLVDIIKNTKDDATKFNLYQAARIWKAYTFMILTDTYGDVPYTEAGLGYISQVLRPKYDYQQDIYTDILKELDEASAALDVTKTKITGEILYSGDVTKWKRFGYSLLMRAAMRLSKVDPAKAQIYVTKAVAGGLLQSNADNAMIKHTAEWPNVNGVEISGTEKGNYYATKAIVNYLRATNDPRLGYLFQRYVGATSFTLQTESRRTKDAAQQKGMPVGYNDITIAQTYAAEGVAGLYDYSQFDWNIFFVNTSPEFYLTYGQTQLLLAEAALRGWTAGTAATFYANGVKADMEVLSQFGTAATIPAATITAYIAANPLVTPTELAQINGEYWVGSIPNGQEAWSNFLRSGFPALTPNPYPASEIPGEFIRRHIYPDRETITNRDNVEAAIAHQGPNKMNARVWWDKL
jgi:hypothetical protein